MRNIQQLLVAILITTLAACGGGGTLDSGGGTGGGGTTTPVYSMAVQLSDSSGQASTELSRATPLSVNVTLTATNNGNIANQLISFSLNDSALAVFGNSAATALTNAEGVATIILAVGEKNGAGTVTAAYGDISASVGFNSAGDGSTVPVYSLTLELLNAEGAPASALSQASPLSISATLSATNSGVVANQLITFELSDTELAVFGNSSATAITNTDGIAVIDLFVGTKSGAGSVLATFSEVTATTSFDSAGDGGGEVDVTVGSVSLIADNLILGSGAGSAVQLSALVRDTNNVVLADIPVVFSTDSGEIVQIDTETGANGVAKATLTTQTDKTVRDINVVARAQQQTSLLTVSVVGTAIEIAAPSSIVLGDTTTVELFLTDSNGTGIQGQEIEVVSSLGNTLSDTSPVTAGAAGKASFTYTAVNSGVDSVTVSALGGNSSASINISADAFAFTETAGQDAEILEIDLNTPQVLGVEWLTNDTPNVGETVTFNTTRGQIADTVVNLNNGNVTAQSETDADGVADVFVRSEFAGIATISAAAGDGAAAVSSSKLVEFVAVNPSKVEAQAFPAQIGPGETSAIRAIVRDANNNPVKNQTVVFALDNAAGGIISTGTAVTNSQGVASTVFTADSTTGTGIEGLNLVVNAALQSNNAIFDATDIAVGKRTLFFRFGTGNLITKPSDSTYAKEFSIIVTDSSGNPVVNQELNVAVVSTGYFKGFWVKSPTPPLAFKNWGPQITAVCFTEDANFNGVLDVGEDTNGNGILTPGNVASVPRTVMADENGIASFLVTYPRDYGAWTSVRLMISGFAQGSENISYRDYILAVAADDITTETNAPPINPLGSSNSCADAN
uniref:Invasin domain protein n=1 Tax=Rheinheimera sp. BAL341 TaxID=1708203 RepID=A0A486XW08_9GAMM